MIRSLLKPCGWTTWQIFVLCAGLTLAIEAVTTLMRFGFGMEAARPGALIQACTLGLRIHHCYTGAVSLLLAAVFHRRPAPRKLLTVIGSALVFSDLIHHFLVLWPIVGRHEFYFVYPELEL